MKERLRKEVLLDSNIVRKLSAKAKKADRSLKKYMELVLKEDAEK